MIHVHNVPDFLSFEPPWLQKLFGATIILDIPDIRPESMQQIPMSRQFRRPRAQTGGTGLRQTRPSVSFKSSVADNTRPGPAQTASAGFHQQRYMSVSGRAKRTRNDGS